jgi:hypothetical protein
MNEPLESSHRLALAEARRRRIWPPDWSEVTREGSKTITRVYSYVNPLPDCLWVIEHDQEQGVFRIIGPDGETMTFRDRPVRYLNARVHAETGENEPVIIQGSDCRPSYLDLCPEEREGR